MHGSRIMDATFGGSLLPLARIVSLDWACGLMLGVPVGLGWAGAMLDERSADREYGESTKCADEGGNDDAGTGALGLALRAS
jgi:hypothetical protein